MPDQPPPNTAAIPSAETADLRRQPVGRVGWLATFSAFQHRNYRIFFFGQCISLIGTWLQSTAEGWLVYDLSGSSVALGFIRFVNMLPFGLLALYGGIVADRHSKRTILVWTQSVSMLLALVLAGLVYGQWIEVWHVATLAALLGVANAFDVPARQSFVVELVGKEDLINGIALNSSMFNLARVIGPAVAGLLIGAVGMAGCFLLNAISYIAVIVGYGWLRLPEHSVQTERSGFRHAIGEALIFVAGNGPLRAIMILVTTFSVFGASFAVLMPVFAKDVLQGDAQSFGLMMASNGFGALLGGVALASVGQRFHRKLLLYVGLFGTCLFIGVFAWSRIFWLSCGLLALAGFFMIFFLATANTATQLRAPDHLRGRIMGVYSLSFLGMSSVGSLLAGALARWIGAPGTLTVGVSICTVVGLATWRRLISIPTEPGSEKLK